MSVPCSQAPFARSIWIQTTPYECNGAVARRPYPQNRAGPLDRDNRRPLAPCARPLDPAVHTGRQPLRLGIKLRRASSPAGVAPPASVGKPRRWKSTAASAGLAASRRTAHRLLRRVLGLPAFD